MITVSIIVTLYNAKCHLKKLFHDMVLQELADKELILVDDHSNDDTFESCVQWGMSLINGRPIRGANATALSVQVGNIKCVKLKENLGVSRARGYALTLAQGEYIGFSDQDDRIDPGHYSGLYQLAVKENVDCAREDYFSGRIGQKTYCSEDIVPDSSAMLEAMFYDKTQGGIWNKLFRKQFIREHQVTFADARLSMCDDFVFLVNFLEHKPKIAYQPQAHYWHVFYDTSQSHTRDRLKVDTQVWVANFLKHKMLGSENQEGVIHYLHRAKFWLAFESSFSNTEFASFLPEIRTIENGISSSLLRRLAYWLALHHCRWIVTHWTASYRRIRDFLGRFKRSIKKNA